MSAPSQAGATERALSAREPVVVLTGPAASGKTAAALDLYRRRLDDLGRPGCLLIVPNAPAAAAARRRLLADAPRSALVAPAVTTFAALAADIAAAAGRCPDRLRPAQRHLLLVRVVSDLAAAGELKALDPLADAPGLPGALDAAIAELKRAAVEPDLLARAIDRRSGRHADLLAVYRRYQQHLLEADRFDVEGQMWLARDILAADPDAPVGRERLTALAVDGFTDFTPTQLEMLALLARRVERALITLPLASDGRRARLWHWTGRTLERLRRAMPGARVVEAAPEADPLPALFDLAAAASGAPAPRSKKKPGAAGPRLTIVEAPDLEAEVAAAARAVKTDLAAGAPADAVAVVARDLDAYGECVERVFADHDVPVGARPGRLDAAGVVRYVLHLASLPPDYAFHDVLAVIRSSYFRPSALGADFGAATVATAEMAVRAANVLGGREAYGRAFSRLAARARAAASEPGDDETVELGPLVADAAAVERAGEMVEALLSAAEALDASASADAYVAALRGLIEALEVPAAAADHADEALVAADLRALAALAEVLDDVSSAGLPAGGLAGVLARAAAVAAAPPARARSPVAVLDVLDVRALRFDHVYLLGVNEKLFPRLTADRCFIGEADRAAWARRGVELDRRSDLLCREMLLFYLAATRASKSLTVSFLSSEASGAASAASAFVDDLLAAAAAAGVEVTRRRISPGDLLPPPEELARPSDAVAGAVLAAFDPARVAYGDPRPLLGWVARHAPAALERASCGVLAVHRRWARGEVDRFDGRIDDADLLADLARRIPARWTFSATELNSYARCPWQFFGRSLLGLEPLVEPEAPVTPAARGAFCHAVLWRVMSALRDRVGGAVMLADIDEADCRAVLDDAVDAERRRLADLAVYPRLWDAQTEHWRRLLWAYLADQRAGRQDGPGVHFELGFGVSERVAGRMDPASRAEPVSIDAGGRRIRLAGKIDRIDRDDAGLLAVDYKSGGVPARKDIAEGRDLQLALYAAAMGEMFGAPAAGGVYHGLRDCSHRYFARVTRIRGRRRPVDDYDEAQAHAMATAGRYVEAIRAGRFDALPDHGCPHYCPYRRICHYAAPRAERKTGGSAGVRPEGGPGDA